MEQKEEREDEQRQQKEEKEMKETEMEKDKEEGEQETKEGYGDEEKEDGQDEERSHGDGSELEKVRALLEIAERKLENSRYVCEAHEAMAVEASRQKAQAESRAKEMERRWQRATEKIEAMQLRAKLLTGESDALQHRDSVDRLEGDIRAIYTDPDLALPISSGKRRGLAGLERRLEALRKKQARHMDSLQRTRHLSGLHEAVRSAASLGDVGKLASLLGKDGAAEGMAVNAPDAASLSAFLYATEGGHLEAVELLLSHGGDVIEGDGKLTPLIAAARKGHCEMVQLLLRAGADVNAVDETGKTSLHCAVSGGFMPTVAALLEAGADVNKPDLYGDTPLHAVAREGPKGGVPGPRGASGPGGGAPLSVDDAIGFDLIPRLKMLVEWGASLSAVNVDNDTPVDVALAKRNHHLLRAMRAFFPEGEEGQADKGITAALRRMEEQQLVVQQQREKEEEQKEKKKKGEEEARQKTKRGATGRNGGGRSGLRATPSATTTTSINPPTATVTAAEEARQVQVAADGGESIGSGSGSGAVEKESTPTELCSGLSDGGSAPVR